MRGIKILFLLCLTLKAYADNLPDAGVMDLRKDQLEPVIDGFSNLATLQTQNKICPNSESFQRTFDASPKETIKKSVLFVTHASTLYTSKNMTGKSGVDREIQDANHCFMI